jgi:hypothetical protein
MNNIKFLLFLSVIVCFIGCGTSHDYTKNNLNKNYFSEKIIFIKIDPNSKNGISLSGITGGQRVNQPDVKETFKNATNELSTETNIKIKLVDSFEGINNDKNNLMFEAHILEIDWYFGFSQTTLKTVVDFKNNTKEIRAIGIRKSGGGDETNNLRKSLKDVTYNFLKEIEKQ